MISINQVSKVRRKAAVLSDVSFRAATGQVTALLGPNGAGKSSLMRILLDLDHPTSGAGFFDGCRYRDLREPLRTVGASVDGGGAHPSRTGRNHLAWVAASNRIPRRRIDEVLGLVDLGSAGSRRIGKYSLGMRQRLGIATALLGEPSTLVLDEPGNGLDPEGIRWVRNLLRTWADQGRTVLVTSHLLAEVEGVADHVVVLVKGRLVAEGSTEAVIGDHHSLEDAYFDLTSDP